MMCLLKAETASNEPGETASGTLAVVHESRQIEISALAPFFLLLATHLGVVACTERNTVSGTDGAGRLGQLRHGSAICPPRGGSSALGGQPDQ